MFQSHPEQLPQLKLRDASKFGTTVDGTKAAGKEEVTVKRGSDIQFGSAETSIFRYIVQD